MSNGNPMSVNGEKWIVSLSDGRTVGEDDGDILQHSQRVSPWGRLQEILQEEGVRITQLRVQVLGRTHTSVGTSPRGKFPSEGDPSYLCMRRMGVDALRPSAVEEHYIGMEVEMGGRKYTTWVDIYSGDSWQQVR